MGLAKLKFPASFWTANTVELFERAAYYAFYISITLYLTDLIGFSDSESGIIAGVFVAGLYFLPSVTGPIADKIGFRTALILAFTVLTIGYTSLGVFTYKSIVFPSLLLVMIGGSFIKAIISGAVAQASDSKKRALAFSIFYMIVNIGSFTGKTFSYQFRVELGLNSILFFSGGISLLALITVIFMFRNIAPDTKSKTVRDVIEGLKNVFRKRELVWLIVIISGFWFIQNQLYASMPKYVLRMVSNDASPEWIANVNPFIVVSLVVLITKMMKHFRAITSMNIGMFLMPISALLMAMGNIISDGKGDVVELFGLFSLHPIVLMMILGIIVQGIAECFISPRYHEYFSLFAPKGEEGTYLGASHLDSFVSTLLGFAASGFLLEAFCPDPKTLPAGLSPQEIASYYSHAHYIWYVFAAVGLLSAISLLIFDKKMKRSKAIAEQ